MYQKFPRNEYHRVLDYRVAPKREICLMFEQVQQHQYLLSSGLIVIFRIRQSGQVFKTILRRDPKLYWRGRAYEMSEYHLPNSIWLWKIVFAKLSSGGRTSKLYGGTCDFDLKIREMHLSSDGAGFVVRFDELSQILSLRKKLTKGLNESAE